MLNIDYNCDRRAFRQMIRGRTLLELFSNDELINTIYEAARAIVGEDPYFYHQRGLYEMHRCNHAAANRLFATAEKLAPQDFTIKHSRSEFLLKEAERARTTLERDVLLREAAQIAHALKAARSGEPHAYHTLAKIDIFRLSNLLSLPQKEPEQAELEVLVKTIEKNLTIGLQHFPGDQYLLTAEADFARLLQDSERVIKSLQRAFEANPRTSFIATRLAAQYRNSGKASEADSVFQKALNANRNDNNLHYQYAKILMENGETNGEILAYHLLRAFTPGDTSYDAQLLYARQLFLNGDRDGAKIVFVSLRDAKLAPIIKRRLLYPLPTTFQGTITRIEGTYLYINRDGINDSIYAHRDNVADAVWARLTVSMRCRYEIAFSFYGAGAQNLMA